MTLAAAVLMPSSMALIRQAYGHAGAGGRVPGHRAGTASGEFKSSRQVEGALAVAVFGALLAQPTTSSKSLRVPLADGTLVATPTT